MRYRAIVFDLFRTLVVTEAVGDGEPDVRQMAGIPAERWDEAWRRHDDARQRGLFRSDAVMFARMAAELGLGWTPERCAEIAASHAAHLRQTLLEIEPDTLRWLGELRARGLRLGLLSDAAFDDVAAWPESPLAPLFDVAVFSCREGLRKPEAAFFRRVLEQLGVEPADCLYVGDGGSDEHRGARALGMTPVLLTRFLRVYWPEQIPERAPLCDHVAADLRDVIELVQR
jgi:putative hydrolase of the HAD superfamily